MDILVLEAADPTARLQRNQRDYRWLLHLQIEGQVAP